jgi:hypothetical protein
MTRFPLKKIILFASFFILLIATQQLLFKEEFSELFSEAYDETEREREEEEQGGMSKQDRMDLAMKQEFQMTVDPATGTVPRERLLIAHDTLVARQFRNNQSLRTSASISGINWTERGPNNWSGRTRAIWVDMNDATKKTVWAGSVGGGLWKTTDITVASPAWTPVNDLFTNLAITGIAQNPANKQEMYFSTGEAYFNADGIRGLGVFKSSDGGVTWNQLASTNNGNFQYIFRVKVDANGVVFVATFYNGLYRSTNGGATFTKVLGSGISGITNSNRCYDIEIAANGDVYSTISYGYYSASPPNATIHKSTDGGATFSTALTLPAGMTADRIELSTAPSDANYVYAVVQSTNSDNSLSGIIKTTNAGTTWTTMTLPTDASNPTPDYASGQSWYDLDITADPNNRDIVYTGGLDLFKSTDGGSSWSQISYWLSGFGYQYVHADQHLIYFEPGNSNVIYFGNDGGIYRSSNGTAATPTISFRGAGYRSIQFYGCAMHPTAGSNVYLAGAQDNGSHRFSVAGLGATTNPTGGDGAFCNIDQDQPAYMWTQYIQNQYYFRSTNGGISFTTALQINNKGRFINPSDYDNTANHMYAGDSIGRYLYWSNPQTAANSAACVFNTPTISAFGGANVTAVTCSDATTDLVFFGLDNGDVVKVANANTATPTATNISTGLPNAYTSCIALERGNENHMLVTFSNYGVNSVWESTNGGTSWTSVEGNLPDMPVRWAMFNPNDATQALLATELGVWSTDLLSAGTTNWGPSNTGLANVRTDMLQWRPSDNLVIASTHGRGLFSTTIFSTTPVTWLSFDARVSGTHALLQWATATEFNSSGFEVERSADGLSFTKIGYILGSNNVNSIQQYNYTDYNTQEGKTYYYRIKQIDTDGNYDYTNIAQVTINLSQVFDFDRVYPNPFSNKLDVSFVTNDSSPVQLELRNIENQVVYQHTMKDGSQPFTVNFTNTPLPAGTYFLSANKQGQVVTKKMVKAQ